MLQSIDWQATDTLVRAQFAIFHEAGDAARVTEAERRRVLGLDGKDWAAWSDFMAEGPLPARPALPDMLRRLAASSHRLTRDAERLGVAT